MSKTALLGPANFSKTKTQTNPRAVVAARSGADSEPREFTGRLGRTPDSIRVNDHLAHCDKRL